MVASPPSLHELSPNDRETLEVLDLYLRACLEAFFVNEGCLEARWVVLLDHCSHELAPWLRKLKGEPQQYFTRLTQFTAQVRRCLICSEPSSCQMRTM